MPSLDATISKVVLDKLDGAMISKVVLDKLDGAAYVSHVRRCYRLFTVFHTYSCILLRGTRTASQLIAFTRCPYLMLHV
jgi:hypothetical protein